MIIHGRSDATLNPGGVRIGTAEIYRQVEQLEEVQEAIVIGQEWDNDVRVVLFVVLKPGQTLDDALRDRIKLKIRTGASPRHVPARIVQVADIPRTKSGKITELAVREVVHGRDGQEQGGAGKSRGAGALQGACRAAALSAEECPGARGTGADVEAGRCPMPLLAPALATSGRCALRAHMPGKRAAWRFWRGERT